MSRRRIAIGSVVLIVVIIGGYLLFRSGSNQETAVVERGSIDVTIDTVGTVQLHDSYPIRAEVGGTVAALGAQPGDQVVAGDILVLLDASELEDTVNEAQRTLEAAEFDLQFAELRLQDNEDSTDLRQNVVQALARVDLAHDTVAAAEEARSNSAILADRPGTVLEVLVGPGDPIGAHQPVAQLYERSDLLLVADVDELDLPNVHGGADVRFRLDSYPATEVSGTVTATSPQATQRGGATLFPADIEFVAPDDLDIRPGMNADVTIVTDLRENVLLIPERALRTVGQRAFVQVERDGSVEEVEVILGYRAGGRAEVVDGLEEGERVRLR